MGKHSYVGIDIGYASLKMALVKNDKVVRVYRQTMPERLLKQGWPVSEETLAEVIRDALKESGIHEKDAALVLADENVFVKNVEMPVMTVPQLKINLPYEFRDYITDELSDYIFDYALEDEIQPEDKQMSLLASAVRKDYLAVMQRVFKKAGLVLKTALPVMCTYIAVIRAQGDHADGEYCFLDLGYKNIRMYIFEGDRFESMRELDMGMYMIDDIVAETRHVDRHLAHTYVTTNFEDCQSSTECVETYSRIAIEIMRALNFYKFSNPDTNLDKIYMVGSGSKIESFRKTLEEQLELDAVDADSLIESQNAEESSSLYLQAIGAALSEDEE